MASHFWEAQWTAKIAPPPQLHYHIRWSGKAELDWEGFGSRADAEASAKELVRPGEAYTIEGRGPECPRCASALSLKTTHGTDIAPDFVKPQFKYPWQQSVMDAFTETRSAYLPGKVNAAQRAISARLCDPAPADLDERIAIQEALKSLKELIPQRSENEDSQEKKATA